MAQAVRAPKMPGYVARTVGEISYFSFLQSAYIPKDEE